ncbi:uncharacterized protein LAESUDRAFT_810472 [Laetiporus sulphureus 93-53]|uniref:F-box domain-containing protein n=1 Tax=Laetiporus sulphureus 93-53 TaxID=1314785 RepID=A0A165FUZ1_9APHY|nr:uncharacterized protein LAESUDRAFT_810472 [Laetiporus sulphureus 93-53]KZT09446.1 hypothetical protein LAESUDRAFT_810472 [Laetiporus sulphureus 93-53]
MSLQPRSLSLKSFNAQGFPKLPLELTDHIIDNLHVDFVSLKNIALVCHAWVASARKHIFFSVTLTGYRKAHAFLAALQSSKDIGRYVKQLDMRINTDYDDPSPFEDVMKHLSSVRSFELNANEVPLNLEIIKSIGPVEEFTMELGEWEELDLKGALFAFPKLSSLVLHTSPGSGICDVASDSPMFPVRKLKTTAFVPSSTYPEAPNLVLSTLLQHKLPLIEALTLAIVADRDLFALREFLRTHEGNIKLLDLSFKYSVDDSAASSLADVLRERCMDIRNVHLKSENIGSTFLLQLVSAFKSSKVERVVVIIHPFASLRWYDVLRSLLSYFDVGFTAASSLIVNIPLNLRHRDAREILEDELARLEAKWPTLFARGILKIDWYDNKHKI